MTEQEAKAVESIMSRLGLGINAGDAKEMLKIVFRQDVTAESQEERK